VASDTSVTHDFLHSKMLRVRRIGVELLLAFELRVQDYVAGVIHGTHIQPDL
jgi:hypothetical protein